MAEAPDVRVFRAWEHGGVTLLHAPYHGRDNTVELHVQNLARLNPELLRHLAEFFNETADALDGGNRD